MKRRTIPTNIQAAPVNVLRCKVCAQHTDVRCSGCRQPICLRHNAAPNTSFHLYCFDCRYGPTTAKKEA